MKAKVHVSFFRSLSRRALRTSSTLRNEGEGKVKACLHLFLHRNDLILNSFSGGVKAKNENSLMCAYARAREKNRGEMLPKQDSFSSIVLVFRAEQVEIR